MTAAADSATRSTATAPDISFVVPAYNEQQALPATLAALHAAAAQAAISYEIIVADDASTDRTAAIAASLGAQVVAVSARQIAATRNAGARAARSQNLVFVDADTQINTAVLHATLTALRAGAVGGGAAMTFDTPAPRYARAVLWLVVRLFRQIRWAAGCYLFCTRTAFDAAGGFDERLYASEEVALSRALKRQGRFVVLRQAVLTSARKARSFSATETLVLLLQLALAGPRGLRARDRLTFWYSRRPDPHSGA